MKTTYLLALSLSLTTVFAAPGKDRVTNLPERTIVSGPETKLQDREEVAFNIMMDELARVHREVFQLSFDYEYVKKTLMPEIEAKRKVIAPHYPSRETTGDDPELVKNAFRAWYKSYPQESKDYIAYVDKFIAEHK